MKDGLKTGLIVGGLILGIVVVFVGLIIAMVIGINNQAVQQEAAIKAQWTQNQNNLSAYSNKIAEAAQIPAMYRDDFVKVVNASMQGRYGDKGSQAVFQWLKEQNLNFDASVYKKLQRMIESGRKDFENEQKKLIDLKRQYEVSLQTVPRGWILSMLGFPKVDLKSFNIVTSDYSNESFKTGVDKGIKLR
jgi:hypothetical protein